MLVVLQFKHLQLYQESIKVFVYSVKLKLELNILSKLVDLVHGSSSTRSITLDLIDSNAIPGQARAAVKQELSGQSPPDSWFTSDGKVARKHIEDSHPTKPGPSPSVSGPLDDNDRITRMVSQHSVYTSRTRGRDSDIDYANVVRSLN